MPIITGKENVTAIYEKAAQKRWVIPCICTENLTTTEAVLAAASEYAVENHLERAPISLAITARYSHRPQAVNYTHTKKWNVGLKLFRDDAAILAKNYENVDLLLHLDHIQYDLDEELLGGDLSGYSSIMYDASALPLEENIAETRKFVQKKGKEIIVEGACDEIVDAGGEAKNSITTPEKCKQYMDNTGVDMVVANLGTEHRASGKDLCYQRDAAKRICREIGPKIVLHGASSVPNEQIRELFSDGICKVNIWTALERDSSPSLLKFMVENASKVGGAQTVEDLIQKGYLTKRCATGEKASLAAFTTSARQGIIFNAMKQIVKDYLNMWYRV